MKHTFLILIGTLLIAGCSGKSALEQKQEELTKYEKQAEEAEARIAELKKEIAALDPSATQQQERSVLVTTVPAQKKHFINFIEVSGSVESKRNITMSAQVPGTIQQIPVQEGQQVKKGQVLLRQNTELQQQNLQELRTSLDLATTLFERQANLWKQRIGTEVQYLQAKANKESLENRIKTLQTEIARATLLAPFSGVVDQVMVREGENAMPGTPLVRVVSLDQVYVQADVSERYLGSIQHGDSVEVNIASLNMKMPGVVRAVGQVINVDNRTFPVEVALLGDQQQLLPKMLAIVRFKSFEQKDAVVVPTNLIQKDRQSEFVFVATKQGDQSLARKVSIERGETYRNETWVKEGLRGNELLISEGFREVVDSMPVRIVEQQ